jgi:hypothetical protein
VAAVSSLPEKGATPTVGAAARPVEKRALFVQPVAAQSTQGVLPLTLAKFAIDEEYVGGQRKVAGRPLASLSPQKEVEFHGFGGGANRFSPNNRLTVRALFAIDSGDVVHHELWSHRPQSLGGTSPSTLMAAFDDAFVGFDISHVSEDGVTSSGRFMFDGVNGERLTPGIYVIAGNSAATNAAPYLRAFKYSGQPRAPIADSADLSRDFDYLSFVVHGEWV